MIDVEKQLEDANRIIKESETALKMAFKDTPVFSLMRDYNKKYLKPVDPLEEKWTKFLYENCDHITDGSETFEIFKEIFKDDLNGTKGLDELIEWMRTRDVPMHKVYDRVQEIKKELES